MAQELLGTTIENDLQFLNSILKEDTKKKIIQWVSQKFSKDFIVELTRHGNPKPGTDDMADAVVIALSHF